MTCKYIKLQEIFESKGCKLLTTNEELAEQSKSYEHKKVSFIAACGHENTVTITNFQQKGSGVTCKNCMKKKVSEKLKTHNKEKVEASKSTIQECEVIEKLQVLLGNNMTFVKTNEGCISDVIIKPLHIEDDKWLRIQVKTTKDVCHGLYSFRLHGTDYTNHIILCYCINHNKYWLIPYNVVSNLKGSLNIGLTSKSNYYKYEIEEHLVYIKLLEYYNETVLYQYDECMLPQCVYQQREMEFQQKRVEKFPFLQFEKPKYNQSCYDFSINGKHVQEKFAYEISSRKNTYYVCLYRSSSQKTKFCKKQYQPYKLGMNSYYWVNIPNTTMFYVFPENTLYQQGYIEGEKQLSTTMPKFSISLNYDEGWYQKFKYNYESINETEFKIMFELM